MTLVRKILLKILITKKKLNDLVRDLIISKQIFLSI